MATPTPPHLPAAAADEAACAQAAAGPAKPLRRLVAHLDMDAFYASVELLRRPDLRGLALVVGGGRRNAESDDLPAERLPRLKDYVGRGVVTTSTYEARKFGVFSGMGLMKSARLAPEALLLPADFEAYRHHSRLFKAAVAQIAPHIEDRGIDEIYLELTELPGAQDGSADDPDAGVRALGRQLKAAVKAATGLSCSIGIAPNKLLAKICSELDKPDGLTLLRADELPTRIWPLPVRRINGIGPKAEFKLQGLGITTIGELAACERAWLVERFGRSYGAWLHAASHGEDERAVVTESEPVSISRETTFDRDLHPRSDREALTAILTRLCEQLGADLTRKGYAARTVGVKVRFDDFRSLTRDTTLAAPVQGAAEVLAAARLSLKRVSFTRRIRLLGVRASSLCPPEAAAAAEPPAADGEDLDALPPGEGVERGEGGVGGLAEGDENAGREGLRGVREAAPPPYGSRSTTRRPVRPVAPASTADVRARPRGGSTRAAAGDADPWSLPLFGDDPGG